MSWFMDSKLVHFAVTHFRYIERATWVNSIESYDHSYQFLASILFIFFSLRNVQNNYKGLFGFKT